MSSLGASDNRQSRLKAVTQSPETKATFHAAPSQSSHRRGALMTETRLRFSLAVTTFLILTAILPPAPASAQLYSHGSRSGSNAVANHSDSIPTSVASSGGTASSDSAVPTP